MIFSISFRLLALIILCSLPITANAHKLRVFAWTEGDTIIGETAFSGKRKPKNVEITVLDDVNHTVLLTTRTDDHGKFSFTIPKQAVQQQIDLLIVVNAGEGHRGEWLLPVAEYSGDTTGLKEDSEINIASQKETTQNISMDEQLLRRIVAEELDKKLAPVKQMLAESRDDKPDLRDILGGIGYIIGLAGLLAWFKAKKQQGIE